MNKYEYEYEYERNGNKQMILKLDITNKQLIEIANNYENLETVKGFGFSPDGNEIAILTAYNTLGLIKTILYIYKDKAVLAKF